jgi:hypothetical protein
VEVDVLLIFSSHLHLLYVLLVCSTIQMCTSVNGGGGVDNNDDDSEVELELEGYDNNDNNKNKGS